MCIRDRILTEPNETPSNRLGTYYLETGYGIRASKVLSLIHILDLGLSSGYMQQKSSAKEEYTPSFDLTGV